MKMNENKKGSYLPANADSLTARKMDAVSAARLKVTKKMLVATNFYHAQCNCHIYYVLTAVAV